MKHDEKTFPTRSIITSNSSFCQAEPFLACGRILPLIDCSYLRLNCPFFCWYSNKVGNWKLFPKHLVKKFIFTFEKIHPYLSNRQAKELMQSCGMFSEALKKKMFSINSHFFQMHFFAISDKANKKWRFLKITKYV